MSQGVESHLSRTVIKHVTPFLQVRCSTNWTTHVKMTSVTCRVIYTQHDTYSVLLYMYVPIYNCSRLLLSQTAVCPAIPVLFWTTSLQLNMNVDDHNICLWIDNLLKYIENNFATPTLKWMQKILTKYIKKIYKICFKFMLSMSFLVGAHAFL